jgi:hypothetical protein
MKINGYLLSFLAAGVLTLLAACGNNEEGTRLVIRLTDSPGDYEEVNVEILDIQVKADGGEGEGGWKSLENVNTGVYNLLELTNGTETVLTSSNYPSGFISQIRLVLGDNNSVKIDGQTYELSTPSAQQSGVKLQLNADLTEGITYAILLDFDAAQSVVKTGSGKFNLKPVVKVVSEALDGAIEGTVVPADLQVAVFAIDGLDTLGSSYVAEGASSFFLGGLPTGSFTLSFDPGDMSGYDGAVMESVSVTVGEITNVGEVTLEPTPVTIQ